MKKLYVLCIFMFISFVLLLFSAIYEVRDVNKKGQLLVGKEIIVFEDTLKVERFVWQNNSFQLSDGLEINKNLLVEFLRKKKNVSM